jgi:hypothetical protein
MSGRLNCRDPGATWSNESFPSAYDASTPLVLCSHPKVSELSFLAIWSVANLLSRCDFMIGLNSQPDGQDAMISEHYCC